MSGITVCNNLQEGLEEALEVGLVGASVEAFQGWEEVWAEG